jgi:hypothetical protein
MPYNEWTHHNGGWKYCVEGIKTTLSCDHGLNFFPNLISEIINGKKVNTKKWTGVYHTTSSCLKKIELKILDKYWQRNCIGLFVFSNYTAIALRNYVNIPVCVLTHPTQSTNINFDWFKFLNNENKKIFFIGGWLRDTNSFEKINCHYEKIVIKCPGIGVKYFGKNRTIDYLPKREYDLALQKNIVYLDFIDTTTNNTMLECIVRNTPICIRKHPSVVEHLGENYPLYFDNYLEAENKINCKETLKRTYEYLKKMDKSKFTIKNFIFQIAKSSIYKSIK